MLGGWTIALVALSYFGMLFAIAAYGDRLARRGNIPLKRPVLYALTLGVYCTSWTFFGSVGLAATKGFDFLPVYLGPILVFTIGAPLLRRIIRVSKSQNITSIADFIAARYGKSELLAAMVTVIAIIGTVPYISLQLKSMSTSVNTLIGVEAGAALNFPFDTALLIACLMAAFAILFGTRHIDATEHQNGLMLAIATESIVKLLAFLTVGIFITFGTLGGLGGLMEIVTRHPEISTRFSGNFNTSSWLSIMVLSTFAIIMLPRQFHVGIVENPHEDDTRKAAWLFPLYLVAINLFVIPIAVAGLLTFGEKSVDADLFVLALPMKMQAPVITMIAFLGGLSAATAMVIVGAVALSIMACNNLVVPMILRRQLALGNREDMGPLLLNIRRSAIILILFFAYIYVSMVGDSFPLASIGLMSFAAIAQFGPAFFGGLFWKRATARGAIAGILAGFLVWAYTLLLPSFVESGWIAESILTDGPMGMAFLRPQMLFGLHLHPLSHGVLWSLTVNLLAYVLVSLSSTQQPIERLQAMVFASGEITFTPKGVGIGRAGITVGHLKRAVARYLGETRTARSFREYELSRDVTLGDEDPADLRALKFTENLLASAVGAASSRLVMTLMLGHENDGMKGAMRLLDDASEAIQYNRDLLQSALDHVQQGLGVFDKDMQLVCWNQQFRSHLDLPARMGRVGMPLDEIIRHIAGNTDSPGTPAMDETARLIDVIVKQMKPFQRALASTGRILEFRTDAVPDGGLVLTISDMTENVMASRALERANVTLESRVRDRTSELTLLNRQFEKARRAAEEANESKTRFLAAAGHDILQPLNAARLYTSSLVERCKEDCEEHRLMVNIDTSLEAVEEIMSTLLDIARIDAGALKPDLRPVSLSEIFSQLAVEFAPIAHEKGLELQVMPCSHAVLSDRILLRRVLQNLLSNAIKYTEAGRVIMGCRLRGSAVSIEVHDSGPGIPGSKHKLIFQEFKRLNTRESGERGLGLGLSIVERIVKVLGHELHLRSVPGSGSVFSLSAPKAELAAYPGPAKQSGKVSRLKMTGLRVLCIDNEPDILNGMKSLLEGWGCDARLAASLKAARELVKDLPKAQHPEMLLVDYHLDDSTGIKVIRALRKLVGSDIPAILITADRSSELQDQARNNLVPVLNKPLKPAALRALMSQTRLQQVAAE